MSKEFIMFVGVPCSGKSTFIRDCMPLPDSEDWVIISTDNIIEERAKAQGKTYSEIFDAEIKSATTEMNLRVQQAVKDNKNIWWDQTNITASSRKKKLSQIPKSYHKIAVLVEEQLNVILERNNNRPGKVIPEKVIRDMFNNLEVPSLSEGFDCVVKALMLKKLV